VVLKDFRGLVPQLSRLTTRKSGESSLNFPHLKQVSLPTLPLKHLRHVVELHPTQNAELLEVANVRLLIPKNTKPLKSPVNSRNLGISHFPNLTNLTIDGFESFSMMNCVGVLQRETINDR
jgi:hypothetical protein